MELSGLFHIEPRPLSPWETTPIRNQSKSVPYEGEKNFLLLLVFEPRIVHP